MDFASSSAPKGQTSVAEVGEIFEQVNQLKNAFDQLDVERTHLQNVERDLKEKYSKLMDNFRKLKIYNSDDRSKDAMLQIRSLELNGSLRAQSREECDQEILSNQVDRNMKSSEVEIIFASRIYPAHTNWTNGRRHSDLTDYSCASQMHSNSNLSASTMIEEMFGTSRSNSYVDVSANQYFPYLISNEEQDRHDSITTICNARIEIFKPIQKLESNRVKKWKLFDNSLCSAQVFPPVRRSAVASQRLQTLDNRGAEQHEWDQPYQCVESFGGVNNRKFKSSDLSLPNTFQSNFILRKNNEIYLS